jgi:hypothetical protein
MAGAVRVALLVLAVISSSWSWRLEVTGLSEELCKPKMMRVTFPNPQEDFVPAQEVPFQ